MDADGVEILHRADGEHVARTVAQHFKFDLFPAIDVLFDEHLRDGRQHQPVVRDRAQFFLVVCNASARAAEGKGGTYDDGIPYLVRDGNAFLHRVSDIGRNDGLPDLLHRFLEQLAVFRTVDGVDVRPDQFYAPLVKEPFLRELTADGQPRLPAERSKQAVRTLLFDDTFDALRGQRFEINFIRKRLVRHDRGGVGVAEHHVDPRVFQYAAGLCPRIIELRGLTDDDRAGTYNKNFFDVASFRHLFFLRPSSP